MSQTIALAAALHFGISTSAAQVDPANTDSPAKELQSLAWMVGTWDVESRDKGSDEVDHTGVETFAWDLDKSFLRGSVTYSGDDQPTCRYVITYDQKEKCYRWWSFFRGGRFDEMTGRVADDGKTVTWQGRYSDKVSHTTVVQISKPGEATWTTTVMNGDTGLYETVGKGVRRTESEGQRESE